MTHYQFRLMRMQRVKEIAMYTKKDRTLEEYKRAGSEMRLFKTLGSKVAVDISKVLSAADTDKFIRALNKIDDICCKADDNLFRDYPEVGNEYTDVFYGSVGAAPRNALDAEMIERARVTANELFE